LLERYGVLTREAALGEGVEGGFAGVYPVLKALEDRGAVRRGYFVAGLGAAQFAIPGAIDRLRSARSSAERADPGGPASEHWRPGVVSGDRDSDAGGVLSAGDDVLVLAATDPAQPFGASLPWPASAGRPARAAGAHVVIIDGHLVAYLERGGRSLVLFPDTDSHPGWPAALGLLITRGRYRSLEITKVDGDPVRETPTADVLRAAGYEDGYKGLVLRPRTPTRR
jgi:ATP-dependent Lhr-like helicase